VTEPGPQRAMKLGVQLANWRHGMPEIGDWLVSEAEAAELRSDIERAESDIASRLSDTTTDAGDDQADAGAKTFEREHELALTQNARELLAQTQRVLSKIDDGSYGVCESCGQPVGKARLQAFPRATLCLDDKQRQERR